MKRAALFLATALLAAGITSCKKDQEINPINEAGNPTTNPSGLDLTSGNTISASVSGIILDESNNPVSGASVYLGTYSTTTNSHGAFLFENVNIDDKHCFVTTNVPGYFPGSRSFDPNSGDMHNLRIKLLPMTNVGSVSSTAGGTVTLSSGAQLVFEPGDIALESGGSYSGGIHVSASYLNPLADDLADIMPGDLLALDANNEEVVLESYGMIAVELFGDAGEPLNVRNGESVEIRLPIQSEMSSAAPSTIPLWYFDEINGNWVEDGMATSSGGMYVGNVTHFSFWNCDRPYPGVSLTLHLTIEGADAAGVQVQLWEVGSAWALGSSMTDADGMISEMAPAGIDMVMHIVDECGDVIYTEAIGVLSSPTDLGTIEIPTASATYTHLTGTITDCDLNPSADGTVAVYVGSSPWPHIFYTDASGNIDEYILMCTPLDITVIGYDHETLTESDATVLPYATSIDFGSIAACEEVGEFITFTLDGDDYSIVDPSIMAIDSGAVAFMLLGGSGTPDMYLDGIPNSVGGHTMNLGTDGWMSVNGLWATSGTLTVNVTAYPATTEGNFSGTFESGGAHTISGSWKADLE